MRRIDGRRQQGSGSHLPSSSLLFLLGLALATPALAAETPLPQAILACAHEADRTSTLAVHDRASGGWRLTTRSNIATTSDGDWTVDCGPTPTEEHTSGSELHRLCQLDEVVMNCLQQQHHWTKGKGDTAGYLFPPR